MLLTELVQSTRVVFGQGLLSTNPGRNGEPSPLEVTVDSYYSYLHKIVPFDRLQSVYDRAVIDHQTTYAINANELKLTWEKMAEEERSAELAKLDDAPRPCSYQHLDEIDRFVEVGSPGKWVTVPCPNCRPVAYRQSFLSRMATPEPERVEMPDTKAVSLGKVVGFAADSSPLGTLHRIAGNEAVCGQCGARFGLLDRDPGTACGASIDGATCPGILTEQPKEGSNVSENDPPELLPTPERR